MEDAKAAATKDPQIALPIIAARYGQLSDDARAVVDRLLAQQLEPSEPRAGEPWYVGENARFLPLFLIREFRIVSALPALRALTDWLETQETPGAPYEWTEVNGIIGSFAQGGTQVAQPPIGTQPPGVPRTTGLDPSDLRVDVIRVSNGPCHVRVIHVPTNTSVTVGDQPTIAENKERAMDLLADELRANNA